MKTSRRDSSPKVTARARKPTATTGTAPREDGNTKSARTRARLLDAAAHILSIKGYAGMRLSDVAEYADMQAPAIYYYFASREELIEEVMWFGLADMRHHLASVLDQAPEGTPGMDRIMLAVEAHLRHELQLSDYATASIRNAGQLPDKIRQRQKAEETKYGAIWRELLESAVADGSVRDDSNIYISQMLIMGALNWAAEWWSPRRGSLDSLVEMAQMFVRNALTPKS